MTALSVKGVKGGVKGTLHIGEPDLMRLCGVCEGCEGSGATYCARARGVEASFPMFGEKFI